MALNKLKGLFVQTEEKESQEINLSDYGFTKEGPYVSEPSEEPMTVDTSDIILPEDIYKDAYLDDLSKSIFKVEEIKSALPANLPNESKKQTVLSMMPISGLELETVIKDAEERVLLLYNLMHGFEINTKECIENYDNQIADLESDIENLKQEKIKAQSILEKQAEIISKEKNRIISIRNFLA